MLSIIIPVYNEQDNIQPLLDELNKYVKEDAEFIFVDDGSKDNTLANIAAIAALDSRIKCISLSRNFGHQNALMAGLQYAKGDIIILMDGDLQHPPALIPAMLEKIKEGFDVVQTRRVSTQNIGAGKKLFSSFFYKFINSMSDTRIEPNVADFRAFTRKVLESILQFEERELFLRGIFSWIGYSTTTIDFTAPERKYGSTKYSSGKMLLLALRGITSFSYKPLRLSFLIGLVISFIALVAGIFYIIAYFQGKTVPGWTSLITAVLFLGGVQLLAIGLLGEYIASIFAESKKRPLYLVKHTINIRS
ncbi:MAG: glycosyltransferase family 2 protein [Ferruginibacter sp.]